MTYKELAGARAGEAADEIPQNNEEKGFATPTGKIELYSTKLEELGYDPLPLLRGTPRAR